MLIVKNSGSRGSEKAPGAMPSIKNKKKWKKLSRKGTTLVP